MLFVGAPPLYNKLHPIKGIYLKGWQSQVYKATKNDNRKKIIEL